jgi:hypothetical protein
MQAKDLTPGLIDALERKCIAVTFEREPKKKKEKALSKKGEAVKQAILSGGFDCRTDATLNVFSELLGEDIRKRKEEKEGKRDYPEFTMIVATENNDSLTYRMHEPILIVSSDGNYGAHALIYENCLLRPGNHLPGRESKEARKATIAEIKSYFEQLKKLVKLDKEITLHRLAENIFNTITPIPTKKAPKKKAAKKK